MFSYRSKAFDLLNVLRQQIVLCPSRLILGIGVDE
jgi:hypothetical protein